jgi:hypothetical protein
MPLLANKNCISKQHSSPVSVKLHVCAYFQQSVQGTLYKVDSFLQDELHDVKLKILGSKNNPTTFSSHIVCHNKQLHTVKLQLQKSHRNTTF